MTGTIQIHSYENQGNWMDSHKGEVLELQAQKLAQLPKLLENYSSKTNLPLKELPKNKIWDIPHSAIFNFENSSVGAEWIIEKAALSKRHINTLAGGCPIISHSDWSNKHFKFNETGIIMIYDWDSLCLIDELYSLGLACSTFTATWEFETRVIPTPEESRRFVKEYETQIDKIFSQQELQVISAYAANTICYIARCMHAYNPEELYSSYFEDTVLNIKDGLYF